MKKILKDLIILSIIFFISFVVSKNFFYENNIKLNNSKLKYSVKHKGLKGAVDFTVDDKGNYYICYKDKIQFIDDKGKSYNILENADFNITSVDYSKDILYFASKTKVYKFNLKNKKTSVLVDNIPNLGDYNKSLVKIKEDELYITIGAATNSGVVGEDNKWAREYPFFCDLSPNKIMLSGQNFNKNTAGAFNTKNTKSMRGQIIPKHFPGNSSIIVYNIKNNKAKTYAWGIRNFKGIDFNKKGNLIISTTGMENRGYRPVKMDLDYIYKVKKGVWYGFPDYSGGDPINSPRFKGKNNTVINFVLDKHPSTNPPAPLYQHKKLNSLGSLAVDKEGKILEPDTIVFYDKESKNIYSLDKLGILNKEGNLSKGNIKSIKIIKNNITMLDNDRGYIYIINNDK